MEVSTILHSSIIKVIKDESLSDSLKSVEFGKAQYYFFNDWLKRANKEIMRYNNGERLEVSTSEYMENIKMETLRKIENDSIDIETYKNFLPVFRHGQKVGHYPDSIVLTFEAFKGFSLTLKIRLQLNTIK